MIEWTDEELMEWDHAQRGHRRTRSYGCLYGVPKPPKEDPGQLEFVGYRSLGPDGYKDVLSPVRSIPEDKSGGLSPQERWLALIRALKPAGLAGAGELGRSIPRDLVHRTLAELSKM